MKGTEHFKNTIKAYLDNRAETDVLFSFQYTKPEKNIDDCITYILNTVQKSRLSRMRVAPRSTSEARERSGFRVYG